MPAWIHERAKHISAKNPSMSESQAWATATQQSHALGKSPKGYGTLEGRRDAKKKYDTPKDDVKTDNPGELESKKVAGVKEKVIEKLRPVASWAEELSGTSPRWHMQEIQDASKLRNEAAHEITSARAAVDAARAAYPRGGLEPTNKAFREWSRATLKRDRARDLLHDHIPAYRDAAKQTHKARVQAAVGAGALAVPVAVVGGVELAKRKTDKSSSMKTAGIAIQYDLEGRPKSAETSDEWLAAHFKDSGTFMVPDRLKDARVDWLQSKCAEVRREAFLDEISKMAMRELMGKEALDPRLTHALAGAGIGAALGGGAGYVGTKAMEDLPMPGEEQPDHAGRNAAIGALMGGVAGGGLGYLSGKGVHDVAQRADDPEKIYGAIQRIQELDPLTVRARTGKSPGYLARKGLQARRGIATKFDLGPEEAEMALQGKFGEAEITPEQAEESLIRYERLRSQKPTLGQVGRYAGLGAVSAPTIGMLKNYITSGPAEILAKPKNIERLGAAQAHGRALAGMAVAGALGSGAIPLVRTQLDQHAEKQKLRQFMDQYHTQQMQVPDGDGGELKTSSAGVGASMTASEYSTPIEGPKRARQTSYIPPGRKLAGVGVGASMTTSEFSGPLGYGGFPQVSAQYSSPVNSLQGRAFNDPTGGRVGSGPVLVPTVKTSGVPLTPRAQFAASSTVGKTPGVLGHRGPSPSMVAKPDGFGRPSPGAVKP
jgi:hypothetical protein